MKVSITILPTKQHTLLELDDSATVATLIKHLKLKPHATIVLHNNKPLPDTQSITDGEHYHIISVASGG